MLCFRSSAGTSGSASLLPSSSLDSVVANHLIFRYILENIEEAQSLSYTFVMANFRLPSIPLLLSIAYFCASSICTPIDSVAGPRTVDNTSDLLRRQDGIFSVLGIAGLGDSTIYPRLEIRDLEKNHPDQWNVFLLGLQRFQAIDQDDKLSYFQIAGIHGRPFVPWDGVKGDDYYWSRYSGYCTHDSNIFPTWHRPFLALFEEVLYLNCREAVSALPNGELKERYLKALPSVRLPYWDWAAIPPEEEGTLPASVQAEFVNVTMPNGTVTITNPLHSYKFHPLPDWVCSCNHHCRCER
ncbi:hypothetical protein PMIN06_009849 [Paraphaeosphaeria minitans]